MATFKVKVYCEDHALWLYTEQAVVDPTWVPAGHAGDTLSGFSVIQKDVFDSLMFSEAPTSNGLIWLLGWSKQTDTGVTLASGSPITQTVPGYHSHTVIEVLTASGMPFTIRATGTSVSEIDGSETAADTEDLNITALGYYQTSKSWVDAPQLSIVEAAKTCTLDVYRKSYWDRLNTDFTIHGARLEFEPDVAAWSIQLQMFYIANDGSESVVENVTLANTDTPPYAAMNEIGKYKRTDYNQFMEGSGEEGLIVKVTQTNIRSFILIATYHD